MTDMMTVSSDAVRTYIRTVREARKISQGQVAARAGLSLRAYANWERKHTASIKPRQLMRVVDFLKVPTSHIKRLLSDKSSEEAGHQLAREIIAQIESLPPNEREAQRQHAIAVIDELLNQSLLDRVLGYAEGLLDRSR